MRQFTLAMVFFVLPLSTAAAEEHTLERWALLATDEVVESGLLDLLTVALSQQESLQLVERESIQVAMRELQLSALVQADQAPQRLQLGKTLKANALMVLSLDRQEDRRLLRVVVCEAQLGVRLWEGRFACNDNADIEKLVQHCAVTVNEVRQRFAGGVRHIIAAPPFLSEDFGQRFHYLQTRCPDLLRSSLMSHAGVAVVEIEEARAILREMESTLSGGLERPIATMVNATYQVTQPDHERRRFVQLKFELAHGDDRREQFEKTLPLESLDAWLLTDFTRHLLSSSENRAPALSVKTQKEILGRHAQRFAELGAWQESVALREAALALDPHDALQRALAISEYQHRNRPDPDRIWLLAQAFKQLSPAQRESEFRRAANDYCVGFDHLAYLIHNRLLGQVDAIGIFGKHAWHESYAVRVAMHNDPLKFECMQPACEAQREFLRNVFPLIKDLPDGRLLPKYLSDPFYGSRYELTSHVAADVSFNKYDAESLASLRDVLTRLLPADDKTTSNILGLFDYLYVPQRGDPSFDAWSKLLTDLSQSDRELARLYGRFASAVEDKRQTKSGNELEALLEEVNRQGRREEPIYEVINLTLMRPKPQPAIAPTAPLPRGDLGPLGRMQLEPIALAVEGEADAAPPLIIGMLRCGECDVYWSKDRFFVMHQPDVLRELKLTDASAEHALFWEVAWDGECIWMHAHGQGIIVIRPGGSRLASFQGMTPGYWKGHRLIGLSPRRALMVGCLGATDRAWCGLLEVDANGKPSANIFFEAKNVAEGRSPEQASADMTTAFRPDELSCVRRADGAEYVLVERNGLSPLLIDSKTLEVATSENAGGMRGLSTRTDFGFAGKRFLHNGQPIWVNSGVASTPNSTQRVYHDGWLYRPGLVWMRQHVPTQKLERLQARTLPHAYWQLRAASTAHYGLVAYDPTNPNQPLSRVTILDEQMAPAKDQEE
jgi:hypothetical protein